MGRHVCQLYGLHLLDSRISVAAGQLSVDDVKITAASRKGLFIIVFAFGAPVLRLLTPWFSADPSARR